MASLRGQRVIQRPFGFAPAGGSSVGEGSLEPFDVLRSGAVAYAVSNSHAKPSSFGTR